MGFESQDHAPNLSHDGTDVTYRCCRRSNCLQHSHEGDLVKEREKQDQQVISINKLVMGLTPVEKLKKKKK
jgi:hypothetical protein